MTTESKIDIMQAWVRGRDIQLRNECHREWIDFDKNLGEPRWNWEVFEYRVKPEPMEIEVYFTPDGKPIVEGVVTREPLRTWTKKKFREVV